MVRGAEGDCAGSGGCCGDRYRGAGANRATGCGGGSGIACAGGAGELAVGSGGDVYGLGDTGFPKERGGTGARGGGVGTAVVEAEDRSRFVVMATDMMTGGGVIGAVCIIVIWTVGIDGGTTVICGRTGVGEAGGVGGTWAGGGPPCSSSFFCSSVTIRVLMSARLCCVSSGLPIRSLWCRCSWNSEDFSPKVRRIHSRNCNSVRALAASR